MPEQVPPSVSRSFEALIPVAIVVVLMTIITIVLGIDLHHLVDKLVAPLVEAGDSLAGVLIPVFLITFSGHLEYTAFLLLGQWHGLYGKCT